MKIHIEVSDDKHRKLLQLKKENGWSLNWIVNKAIENLLKITLGNRLTQKG